MGVVIDQSKCIGCRQCVRICPGNIIRLDEKGKAYLKRPQDCWSCVSCMKECAKGAISLGLSAQMGGRGGIMTARKDGKSTWWTVTKSDGDKEILITNTDEANRY